MRRSPLFRLGLAVLAAAVCGAGPAAPAHADPDTGTLAGRLTDRADEAAAGATVSVYDDEDPDLLLGGATTDADGRFTAADLAAGGVKVRFTYQGAAWWAGGTADWNEAEVVTVTAGGTTTIDTKLPAVALRGRLVDHAGKPVADGTVQVFDDNDVNLIDSNVTDADGRFAFVGMPPGKVKLSFRHHGFEMWAGGVTDYDHAEVFTVTAGKTTTVEGKLPPLGTLQGRLIDQAGAPVPAKQVRAFEEKTGDLSYGETDEDGRWTLAVPPGGYVVSFEINGFEQWAPRTREYGRATLLPVDAGQTVAVDETLLPAGEVTGTLVDAKGRAVRGAEVALYQDGQSSDYAQTDEDGHFSFQRVFAGTWKVRFLPEKAPAQWAYGKSTQATATPITVPADGVVTVNEKLLVLGTVAGRFTTPKGKGIAKATVEVLAASDDEEVERELRVKTDSKGGYKVTGVLPGKYKVSFTDRTNRTQYAHGKGTRAAGKVFAVTSSKTTTVNDKQVAPATLRITAVDAKTGKKLNSFCASVSTRSDDNSCTRKGVVVVKNLPAAATTVDVDPPSNSLYLGRWGLRARTAAGKTTKLTARLQLGGAIKTTAVDRGTGRAVKDVCFATVVPGAGGLPDGYGDCTDAKGAARISSIAPGTYNVFVIPRGKYGKQWLGRSGGTGDQRKATKVTVKPGKVANAPKVELDKAGTITGTVTTSEGKPATSGDASITAWHYRVGGSHGDDFDRQGRYTLDDLGPYRWPLVFTTDQGRQWSGGKGNRYAATTVQVRAGATVTHDEVIRRQSQLTGKVTVRTGTIVSGFLMARTASTGDPIGDIWFQADGGYTMLVPGGERVKIEYDIDTGTDDYVNGWYDAAETFGKAKIVAVPATGTKTLDVTVR